MNQQHDQNVDKQLKRIEKVNNSHLFHSSQVQYSNQKQRNIIDSLNSLQEGINFIVPAFWYQELKEINQKLTHIQNIRIPSIESYVQVLQLCGLKNPQNYSSILQQLSNDSALHQSNFFHQSNFLNSKRLTFSKVTSFINAHQFEWSVLNFFMMQLIENKLKQIQQETSNYLQNYGAQNNHCFEPRNNLKNCFKNQLQIFPKIAVFLRKQFILSEGRSISKHLEQDKCFQNVKIRLKNKMYFISKVQLNKQISHQLKQMSQNQINLVLISDRQQKSGVYFEKLQIQGFFPKSLPLKDLTKNLIQSSSMKKNQTSQKFYYYNAFGQKSVKKFTNVNSFAQSSQNLSPLIITTNPLKQIFETQVGIKKQLGYLLQKQFNFPLLNNNQSIKNKLQENHKEGIQRIKNSFQNHKCKTQNQQLISFLSIKSDDLVQLKYQNKEKCFDHPVKIRQLIEEKIQNGTFFKSDSSYQYKSRRSFNLNSNNNNQDQRNFDSVTTNFDTPNFDFENSNNNFSQINAHSQSSYRNNRLYRRSSFNRNQRKRKSQKFLMKKKNKEESEKKCIQSSAKLQINKRYSLDQKKRIKHNLLLSLNNLAENNQNQALQFLLQNMRKVALDSILSEQNQLIMHPYPKQCQSNQRNKQLNLQDQTESSTKNKQISPDQKQKLILNNKFRQSLQKIAVRIQIRYQPEYFHEKYYSNFDQKQQYLQKMDLYQSEYLLSKKDEQIKTIVDNSQGPYTNSQVQKSSLNVRISQYNPLRMVQNKGISVMLNVNDKKGYMSDGNNEFQDDETI